MKPMTEVAGTPDREDIRPGMAHFAGTGPQGTWCKHCLFLHVNKYGPGEKGTCGKYRKIMGKPGPKFPVMTPSCRYYERNKEA